MKRSRAYFRDQRKRHIEHRKRYDRSIYGDYQFFEYDGQYGDNKPYCNCPICAQKTNNKGRRGNRFMKPMEWKHSDQQKIDRMDYQENEEN